MDGLSGLKRAIRSTPVPGAPPRLSRDGASIGLAFLDAALRLNHVRRLTERLTIADHGTARRTTEIDLSLRLLDTDQRNAAMHLQQLYGPVVRVAGQAQLSNTLWVPVARISRRSVFPIDVRDASGRELPCLTQYETSRLMASGLYRLLRAILLSERDATRPHSDLGRFLEQMHEPRWLLQQALITLLTEQHKPEVELSEYDGRQVRPPGAGAQDPVDPVRRIETGSGGQYRELSLSILEMYREPLAQFFDLLSVAVDNYLLVVGLNEADDEHLLSYESPLDINRDVGLLADVRRAQRANRDGYCIEYLADIPSTLRSYHLVMETSNDVVIEQMFLSTNADAEAAARLHADLLTLARELSVEPLENVQAPFRKALELEAQTVLRKLAELLRRRRWEAEHAGTAVVPSPHPACDLIADAVVSGAAVRKTNDGHADNSILEHPDVTADQLRKAAEEVREQQLGLDLSVDNDPTKTRAHTYWRRRTAGGRSGQIRVQARLLLRDTAAAGGRSVMTYVLALAGMAYLMASLLTKHIWPLSANAVAGIAATSNSDAVVAVLLLIPGFFFTRLTVAPRYSIAWHLRLVPRYAAQLSIGAVALLAAAVAVGASGWLLLVAMILAITAPLLCGLGLLRVQGRRPETDLARLGAPAWVCADRSNHAIKPDVRFRSFRRADDHD
ncbi:hypothetical protein [Flindersiella endophytica]